MTIKYIIKMRKPLKFNWIKICLMNLLIVAAFGVLMRYKIGFEFPFFNQKNLQYAHSHFAFSGWISLLLMVLIFCTIKHQISYHTKLLFDKIFSAFLISAFGMLISFSIQGYGLFSILFSTLSVLISLVFCILFLYVTKNEKKLAGKNWMYAALLFNILSMLGTLLLSYMMASKKIDQHVYLASVYWYLHFQYNGWFFFSCVGIFINYLKEKNIILNNENILFWIFFISCIPAYGLSVLWMNPPTWIYAIIVVSAIAQFYGLINFIYQFVLSKAIKILRFNTLKKILLLFVSISLFIKIGLQLISTVPAISKLAFGFRPIVIAYLHLVLLAFTSVFLISYLYFKELIRFTKLSIGGIIIFISGILLNELVLTIQGIASLSYIVILFVNEILFSIALIIFWGLILINTSGSLKEE